MTEGNDISDRDKTAISLYELYAISIERLLVKAPWELEQAVSAYRESFLTEQRCLGLAILVLLGEDHVPESALNSMPGFEDQIRASVNQATFLRALKHYFMSKGQNKSRADMVLERMQSYLTDSREASMHNISPLEAMLGTLSRRVPPKDDTQTAHYATRVNKMYEYIEGLVEQKLLQRYEITS